MPTENHTLELLSMESSPYWTRTFQLQSTSSNESRARARSRTISQTIAFQSNALDIYRTSIECKNGLQFRNMTPLRLS